MKGIIQSCPDCAFTFASASGCRRSWQTTQSMGLRSCSPANRYQQCGAGGYNSGFALRSSAAAAVAIAAIVLPRLLESHLQECRAIKRNFPSSFKNSL